MSVSTETCPSGLALNIPQDASSPAVATTCTILLVGGVPGLNGEDGWLLHLAFALHHRGWPVQYLMLGATENLDEIQCPFPLHVCPTEDTVGRSTWLRKHLKLARPSVFVTTSEWDAYRLTEQLPPKTGFVGILTVDHPRYYDRARRTTPALSAFACASKLIRDTLVAIAPALADRAFLIPAPGMPSLPGGIPRATQTGPLRLLVTGPLESAARRILDVPPLVNQLERAGTDFILDIVGPGPAKPDLLARLETSTQNGRVRFRLARDEAHEREIDAAHDAILFFGEYDAVSTQIFRAMAQGCVPVLADCGQLPDIFVDGVNCLRFPACDIGAARAAVQRLQKPGVLAALSRGAIETAESQRADMAAQAESFENILRPVIEAVLHDTRAPSVSAASPAEAMSLPLFGAYELQRPENFFRQLAAALPPEVVNPVVPPITRLPWKPETRQRINALWDRKPQWPGGHISQDDACFLETMIDRIEPEFFHEIGVASGWSSAVLLSSLARRGDPDGCWLHSHDPMTVCYFNPLYPLGAAVAETVPELQRHWDLRMRTTAIDLPYQPQRRRKSIYFIDAMHNHPWPVIDLISLLPQLRPGDCVILHDIRLTEISKGKYPHHGAQTLFDQWPGERFTSDVPLFNIGAIIMPDDWRVAFAAVMKILQIPWQMEFYVPYAHIQTCEWRLFHFLRQRALLPA